ncbi:MAG: hypothetical protein GC161_00740 [Planctomycetaceae bacterium]|nr:hypothetical protein [Planctomycetaceae bacterium]
MNERPHGRRGGALAYLAAAALAVPSLVHGLYHGWLAGAPEQAWLVLVAFGVPWLAGARYLRSPGAAELLLARGVALAFALPLVPVVAHVLPFEFERAVLHGCLAAALVAGGGARALAGLRGAAGPARWAVVVLCLWAAWSVGSAVLGVLGALPEGTPFAGALFEAAAKDVLVPRSAIEAVHSLRALLLRLESLAIVALALGLALERGDGGRSLLCEGARAASLALLVGFAMAWVELARASHWRGESFFARLAAGLGRMHRPLLDNNALGSALLVWLPLAAVLATGWVAHRVRGPGRGAGSLAGTGRAASVGALALAAGLFLMLTARSKAAQGAALFAFLVFVLATLGARRVLVRPLVLGPLVLLGVVLLAVQWVPLETLGRFAATSRYAEDFVRTTRLEYNTSYLRENRSAPWLGAIALTGRAPVFGHGLGSFPLRLGDVHDPARQVAFNPRHENAHNQVLQWSAEEGLPGAALGLALFGLALVGSWRATSRARAGAPGLFDAEAFEAAAVPAALLGLALNVQLGHPLLELGAAYPIALLVGMGLAGFAHGAPAAQVPRRFVLAGGMVLAVALPLVAAAVRERPPLPSALMGCFPWVERTGVPPRDRLLGDDARWMQTWGAGSRLLLPVRDVRDLRSAHDAGPMRVDLYAGDTVLLRGVELPMAPNATEGAPVLLLKADAPAGVRPGDLVELRLVVSPPFAETLQFSTGRVRIGVRAAQAAFVDPR